MTRCSTSKLIVEVIIYSSKMMKTTILFVLAWLSLNQEVASTLNAKAWQSTSGTPVAADFPETEILKNKPSTAIGFTGGGSRAFVASFGILSALNELDLIKNIRYVSGISGGAWATTVFTYAQNLDDKKFLGPIVQPEKITEAGLKQMDPQCARGLASKNLTLVALKAWKDGVVDSLPSGWCYAVADSYLEPVGITKKTRFSWNAATVKDIKARNPSLENEKFLLPSNTDRPFSLIGTTLVGPTAGSPYKTDQQNFTMIEITPLYIGQYKNIDVSYKYAVGRRTKRVGGAVESFAFARKGEAPSTGLSSSEKSGILKVPEPVELMDLMYSAGASGYAPGAFVESVPVVADAMGLQVDYWSPADRKPEATNTLFADGGSYENIPLISFLQRRVEKVVLFIVSSTPLQPANKYNPAVDTFDGTQLSDSVTCFFGVLARDTPTWQNRSYEYEKDQVFATSDYANVISSLQAAQAKGQGIVSTHTLTTIANDWWGVPAGLKVEVTFSYLGRIQSWESKLSSRMHSLAVPAENADDLSVDINEGPFKGFPHYFTSGGEINAERANLLADLTGYSVLNNADTYRKIFS